MEKLESIFDDLLLGKVDKAEGSRRWVTLLEVIDSARVSLESQKEMTDSEIDDEIHLINTAMSEVCEISFLYREDRFFVGFPKLILEWIVDTVCLIVDRAREYSIVPDGMQELTSHTTELVERSIRGPEKKEEKECLLKKMEVSLEKYFHEVFLGKGLYRM